MISSVKNSEEWLFLKEAVNSADISKTNLDKTINGDN